MTRCIALAFGAALALAGPALADGTVPKWQQALPGTAAFLGDDGGGADTATVCDTVEHFMDWVV